jgi:hypothetical protein
MNLELNDVRAEVLIRELQSIIQNDRYPLSPRIVALKEISGLLRPEPEREPLPPRRHYGPATKGDGALRRGGEVLCHHIWLPIPRIYAIF